MFGPSQWEINALVIISAQLHDIQHKLDVLLADSPTVSAEQLAQLTKGTHDLHQQSQELNRAIEQQQKKEKGQKYGSRPATTH